MLLTDINDALGREVAADLGASAAYRTLDVRDEQHWIDGFAELAERFGKADILVNHAGITGFDGPVVPHDREHASLEDWRSVHAVNLDGVFLGCKHAIAAMRPARAGSIINMSSRSGLVGIPGAAAYASSKAAVRDHTRPPRRICGHTATRIERPRQ